MDRMVEYVKSDQPVINSVRLMAFHEAATTCQYNYGMSVTSRQARHASAYSGVPKHLPLRTWSLTPVSGGLGVNRNYSRGIAFWLCIGLEGMQEGPWFEYHHHRSFNTHALSTF